MNQIRKISFGILTLALVFSSCKKEPSNSPIVYKPVNKEYVLIRDVQTLKASNDEISNHVDSILNGELLEEFVSTGRKRFDLTGNQQFDIGFEIIDLNRFNANAIPNSFDTLAARVIPINVEILDNSTYGYPDALSLDDPIAAVGNWSNRTSVLGTFLNAGKFQGNGEKYLAIRFAGTTGYQYGWVKLYCSQHNDTLRIIEYAYNSIEDGNIKAGQKE